MARPAQTGGGAPTQGQTLTDKHEGGVAAGGQAPTQNQNTEKKPSNPENPVVFFDITIGG